MRCPIVVNQWWRCYTIGGGAVASPPDSSVCFVCVCVCVSVDAAFRRRHSRRCGVGWGGGWWLGAGEGGAANIYSGGEHSYNSVRQHSTHAAATTLRWHKVSD